MSRFSSVILVLILLLTVWNTWRSTASDEPVAEGEQQLDAALAQGEALEKTGRFGAAKIAYEKGLLAQDIEHRQRALNASFRARALSFVATIDDPPRQMHGELTALAETLEADGGANQTVGMLLRAVVHRAAGRVEEATTLLEKVLQTDENNAWAHWLVGVLYLRRGSVTDAVKHLEKVARGRPDFAPGLHQLGLAYATRKEFESATRSLQTAISHGAGHEAELDLGRLFLARKMWSESLSHLENSLRARPTRAETVRMIAAANYHLKRYDLAVETYLKAYALEPEPRTLLSAAIAHHGAGSYASALNLLEQLVPHERAVPEVHYQSALALEKLSRPTEARAALQRYVALAKGRGSEKTRLIEAMKLLGAPPQTSNVKTHTHHR